MEKSKNKKITLLYVLKILKEGSDKEHPISQSVITRTINLLGIKCERKTISRDIDCLIKFGYNIKKNIGGGCYLENAEFSVDDVDNLLKGVNKLDNLDPNEKMVLKTKVKKLINVNKR
jgi:hypothetical protein